MFSGESVRLVLLMFILLTALVTYRRARRNGGAAVRYHAFVMGGCLLLAASWMLESWSRVGGMVVGVIGLLLCLASLAYLATPAGRPRNTR